MKKQVYIAMFVLGVLNGRAQQFRAGVSWNALHQLDVQLNKPMVLDTFLQDNRLFQINFIRPNKPLQIDLPGIYMEMGWKNNVFVKLDFRFSRTALTAGANAKQGSDTLLLTDSWKFFRPVTGIEIGYYLGNKKSIQPFISAGFSSTRIVYTNKSITTFGYKDYNTLNYYEYFQTNPWFSSLQLKAGLKWKAFGFNIAYRTSITPVDVENYIRKFNSFTYAELSYDFYRSPYKGKTQFNEEKTEQEIKFTTTVDLKQKSGCTGIRLAFYGLVLSGNYVDAYVEDGKYKRVFVHERPDSKLVPEIYASHARGLGKKKKLYIKSEYGLNFVRVVFPAAVTTTTAITQTPDTYTGIDIQEESFDIKQQYLNAFYALKPGLRLKFGRKAYIYGETGLRASRHFNSYKEPVFIPPLKRWILSSQTEAGLHVNHKGIVMGFHFSVGKTDGYNMYKSLNVFYIGIYHEISSK